jgi:drug/metabolite transporter (DMT)-like permease
LNRSRAHLLLFLVVLAWAGAFAAIKHLLQSGLAGPEVAAFRYLVAAPGFAVALAASGGLRGVKRADLARIALLGLLAVGVYHVGLNEGERFTTSGTASVIVSTAPAMTLALALALGMERFSPARTAGLVVAFAGVVIVVLLGAGQSISFHNAKGPLIVLCAPVAWTLYNVMAKPLVARQSPIAVSSAASLAGTVLLLPLLSAHSLHTARSMDLLDWALVVYLGVLCTLAAYIAWTTALQHLDASMAMAYLYVIPVLAVGIGAVALGEHVTVWLAAGTALVVGGLGLAQLPAWRPRRARAAQVAASD